jgi:Microcystin-dependent protein
MAEPFLSEIRLFSFNFPPKGWALCNGQLMPINQNQALFALLGTTYGGDGRVNFALPDLRGRVPIHWGNEFTLGQRGGQEAHTLTAAEIAPHTHALTAKRTPADDRSPAGRLWAATGVSAYHTGGAGEGGGAAVQLHESIIEPAGGSQPHYNVQPFLTVSYCIALQGIFPSPN